MTHHKLSLPMLAQPNEITCGPTCLHAVYRYYGDDISLDQVIEEVHMLEEGGTLAMLLGTHALRRGYKVTLYTYNLKVFDPTWAQLDAKALSAKLEEQMLYKHSRKMTIASRAYLEYLKLGGELRFRDLTAALIQSYLVKDIPILTGLSSTYLYKSRREYGLESIEDDIRGEPQGHFVILTGYDSRENIVTIADPYLPNPMSYDHEYRIDMEHLVCAILLGIMTYDGNLLIITK